MGQRLEMRFSLSFYHFVCLGVYASVILALVSGDEIGEISELHSKAYFEWKIKDFFSWTVKDSYYFSPTFLFCGESWYLKIYPNGAKENESTGFIGLFVVRAKQGVSKTVNYKLGIKRADATEENIKEDSRLFLEKGWGWSKFLERSHILRRKSELAPLNILTITCTMEVGEAFSLKSVNILSEDMKNLLLFGQDHDVTLRVKDKEFRAHKGILEARSHVFSSIFKHNNTEKENGSIYIDDCEPNAFREFLFYVYTGKAENISLSNVIDLYHLASKFLFPELKQQCVQLMKASLSASSFSDVLLLAEKYNETDLLRSATYFLHENMEVILLTPEWQIFLKENPIAANELYIKALKTCHAQN